MAQKPPPGILGIYLRSAMVEQYELMKGESLVPWKKIAKSVILAVPSRSALLEFELSIFRVRTFLGKGSSMTFQSLHKK